MTKLTTFAALLLAAACSSEADIGSSNGKITLCDPNSCTDPAPLSPNYQCADGTVAGPACVQDSNANSNTCSWQIVDCQNDPTMGGGSGGTNTCSNADCGPAPGTPNWTCWDGSIAGPTCGLVDANNGTPTCGWQIIDCPMNPNDPTTPTCGANSCPDPAPASPNYLCSDGMTIAGPACVAATNANTCTWTIVDCP